MNVIDVSRAFDLIEETGGHLLELEVRREDGSRALVLFVRGDRELDDILASIRAVKAEWQANNE